MTAHELHEILTRIEHTVGNRTIIHGKAQHAKSQLKQGDISAVKDTMVDAEGIAVEADYHNDILDFCRLAHEHAAVLTTPKHPSKIYTVPPYALPENESFYPTAYKQANVQH